MSCDQWWLHHASTEGISLADWCYNYYLVCVLFFFQPPKVELGEDALNVDDIPIETLDLGVEIQASTGLEGLASADKYYQESLNAEKKRKKERRWAHCVLISRSHCHCYCQTYTWRKLRDCIIFHTWKILKLKIWMKSFCWDAWAFEMTWYSHSLIFSFKLDCFKFAYAIIMIIMSSQMPLH